MKTRNMTASQLINSVNLWPLRRGFFLIPFVLVWFALLPKAQAVIPLPDGGYANFTTAEGTNALLHLTSGAANTGVGWSSLFSNAGGSFNTAVGAGTLLANTADENTATGAGALLSNTTGIRNTALGATALLNNDIGFDNNAVGAEALRQNHNGSGNNAVGYIALFSNISGGYNTAVGDAALAFCTGDSNTALGSAAGFNQASGSHNIYIGAGVSGVTDENNTIRTGDNLTTASGSSACYVGGIYGQLYDPATGLSIRVDANNKLGIAPSSKRFKKDIKPMDKASEAILALKPVAFHYKSDKKNTPQFGLVAEDVAQVNPDLIVRDKNGEPLSVRYEQINAMLLNEFLKEHRRIQEQDKRIEELTSQLKEQAAQIQKVSAQLELSKAEPQTVLNRQ